MANYQNNMRCGRAGNVYQQRPSYRRQTPGTMNRSMSNPTGLQRRMESDDGCGCGNNARQQRSRMPERCSDTRESDEVKACRCREEDELGGMPLAMAYVPWQKWCDIYEPQEGFARGTVFAQLDKPFHGRGGCNR